MPFDEFASGVTTLTGIRKPAAGDDVFSSGVTGGPQDRFVIDADGTHRWGPGNAGTDVFFYRQSDSKLRSSGHLYADLNIAARIGQAAQVNLGALGPGSSPALVFGSAGDTNLYRAAADLLRTDDRFSISLAAADGSHALGFLNTGGSSLVRFETYNGGADVRLHMAPSGTGIDTVILGSEGLTIIDRNVVLGTVTGTKIGTDPAQKLGFYNATPIIRPNVTGSRATGVALQNLLTELARLGLILDSTIA